MYDPFKYSYVTDHEDDEEEDHHYNDDGEQQRQKYGFDLYSRRVHAKTALETPILDPEEAAGALNENDPVEGKVFTGIYENPYTGKRYRLYEDDVDYLDLKTFSEKHKLVPQRDANGNINPDAPFVGHNRRLVFLQGGYDRNMPYPDKDEGSVDVSSHRDAQMPDFRNPYMQYKQSESVRKAMNDRVERNSFFSVRNDDGDELRIHDNFPTGFFGQSKARRVIPIMPATQRATYEHKRVHFGPGARNEHEAPADFASDMDYNLWEGERNANILEHQNMSAYPDGNPALEQQPNLQSKEDDDVMKQIFYSIGENNLSERKLDFETNSPYGQNQNDIYFDDHIINYKNNKHGDDYVQELIKSSIKRELVDGHEVDMYRFRSIPSWQMENAATTVAQQHAFKMYDKDMQARAKIAASQEIPASFFDNYNYVEIPNSVSTGQIMAMVGASDERPAKYDYFLKSNSDINAYVSQFDKDDIFYNLNNLVHEVQNLNEKNRKTVYDIAQPRVAAIQNMSLPFSNVTGGDAELAARFLNREELSKHLEKGIDTDTWRFVDYHRSVASPALSQMMAAQSALSTRFMRETPLNKMNFEVDPADAHLQNATAMESLGNSFYGSKKNYEKGRLNRDLDSVPHNLSSNTYAVLEGSNNETARKMSESEEQAQYSEIFARRKNDFMSEETNNMYGGTVQTTVYPTLRSLTSSSSQHTMYDSERKKMSDDSYANYYDGKQLYFHKPTLAE